MKQTLWLGLQWAYSKCNSWAVVIVLAIAACLRFYGIDWDHGYLFHPDERAILFYVNDMSWPDLNELGVLLDPEASPMNPKWFPYGSLPLYLVKFVDTLLSYFMSIEFYDLRFIGRSISALADLGTISFVFLLARRLYNRKIALLASIFVALSVIHIQLSHFYAVDTYLTFFVLGAMYFMSRIMQYGARRDSILAGCFVGLAFASKISVFLIYVPLLFAFGVFIWERYRKDPENLRRFISASALNIFLAFFASLLVFFVTTPYAFIDWSRPQACDIPFSYLQFLGNNYFLCDVGAQYSMAKGTSGLPFTQQYIGSVPYWYQIKQLSLFGLGLPLGVVTWFSLVFSLFLSVKYRNRGDLLILSWLLPYFILTGNMQVKFLRYLLPISPLLMIICARIIYWLRDYAFVRDIRLHRIITILIGFLLLSSAFYAIAYSNIYRSTHSAVLASRWIQDHVPVGSVILKEHWEEQIPDLGRYKIGCGNQWDSISCMRMYDDDSVMYPDGTDKITRVSQQLAGADYLVLFSNRLYGTIPRVLDKYPLSANYYKRLFDGSLGYRLDHWESNTPSLLGINLSDDTFSYPGLAEPEGIKQAGLSLNMGYADESFTVYDHPKVLIFKNISRLNATQLKDKIYSFNDNYRESDGFLLNPDDLKSQRSGGTWSDIFPRDSNANAGYYSPLIWLLAIEFLGLLIFPLTFLIFNNLGDKGYLLSKTLGLLIVSYLVWIISSSHLMGFSSLSIVLVIGLLAVVSFVSLYKNLTLILQFVKTNIRLLIIGELIFISVFALFLLLRMSNPDLWHQFNGGEKPMEMAYINAILKSTYMPPYDPWFSGGYMNYYYFGFFIVTILIKMTGIVPEVAFNLAVPTIASLVAISVFSIVYNLASGAHIALDRAKYFCLSPILAAMLGILFVCFSSNMDGLFQLLKGFGRILNGEQFGSFDYWASSRAIPPGDPNGYEITEFPLFTFIFGDLHPHLISMPFALLSLGISLATMLKFANGVSLAHRAVLLLSLGMSIGSLRAINTWDLPTYIAIGFMSIFLGEYLRDRVFLNRRLILYTLSQCFIVYLFSYTLFWPFISNYHPFVSGVDISQWQTPIYAYLAIHSVFIFILISFLVSESRNFNITNANPEYLRHMSKIFWIGLFIAISVALVISGYSTVVFLSTLIGLVFWISYRWTSASKPNPFGIFALLLIGTGLGLGAGVDILTINGDIARMNTVFKFYIQAWVLLGIGSAYLLWHIKLGTIFMLKRSPLGILGTRRFLIWSVVFFILLSSTSIYMFAGTHDRLRDRMQFTGMTLDGLRFMHDSHYSFDNGSAINNLNWDYQAIQWIRNNVIGSPVILEGQGELYRTLHGRASIYTGLPTVLGWDNHQSQQRGYGKTINDRKVDIELMYSSRDWDKTIRLLERYQVEYIYVGEIERHFYSDAGLTKFQLQIGKALDVVYSNNGVTIYKLK